jgi:hypothetical protein
MIRTGLLSLFVVLLVVAQSGCVGRRIAMQSTVDAMRAEQMELVDRYYRLESNYRKAERELARLRRVHGEDAGLDLEGDGGEESSSAAEEGTSGVYRYEESDAGSGVVENTPPNTLRYEDPITEDTIATLDLQTAPQAREGSGLQPVGETDALESDWTPPSTAQSTPEIRDWRITHVVINPLLSKGKNIDGRYGDDGITLVIEPRNADDKYVPASAPLTISLIDPEESGEEQRIGLWKLTAEEVEPRVYQPSDKSHGIQLTLPWQNHAPRNRKLLVFVRYETPEGEQLETSNEINVLLPQAGISSWQPRETPIMQVDYKEPVETRESSFEVQPAAASQTSFPENRGSKIPASRLARPRWSPYR